MGNKSWHIIVRLILLATVTHCTRSRKSLLKHDIYEDDVNLGRTRRLTVKGPLNCRGKADVMENSNINEAVGLYYYNRREALRQRDHIQCWDVSRVTNMKGLFMNMRAHNYNLSRWNVSGVTNMNHMFASSHWPFVGMHSFNADISGWDVSKVRDMASMFYGVERFNVDLSAWDTSNVTDMNRMLENTAFNHDLSKWNIKKVTQMQWMFAKNPHFNQQLCWNGNLHHTMFIAGSGCVKRECCRNCDEYTLC